MVKLVFREIRARFGRWLAILAIIALGSGFLSGLLQTAPAMRAEMCEYIRSSALYDWRVELPGGVDASLVRAAADVRGVRAAESAIYADALFDSAIGSDEVFRAHSLTERLNHVTLRAGRMPERPDECIADSKAFSAADLGGTVRVSDKNAREAADEFAYREYTIVGVAASPLYINYERGNSAVGSGTVRAFLYLTREGFRSPADNELYLTLETEAQPYSESYDRILRMTERRLTRFAAEHLGDVDADSAYVVNRNANVGYASFESDSEIVAGVARVFPLFFFLVAALVCVTTMTRMVDEQRTQIGVLRAMGFGTCRILGSYLLYAGSAAVLGCVSGFFLGSAVIPRVIWAAYNIMYQQGPLHYRFDYALGAALTAAFLAVSCLATALVFRREDRDMPAQLLRPRAPKAGRRTLIERLPALGKRLGVSGKVTLRNLLRDYGRLLMTVTGIAGCTALLLAGYGMRDSISGIVSAQFDEVVLYDYLAVFAAEPDADTLRAFSDGPGRALEQWQLIYQSNMDFDAGGTTKTAIVAASPEGTLDGLVDLHHDGAHAVYPGRGEALVSTKVAEILGIDKGDPLTLRGADGDYLELTVSGVFDNYFYNYVVLSMDTISDQWGAVPERHMLISRLAPGGDLHRTAAELLGFDGVISVMVSDDIAERVDAMMDALNYIVWLAIVCSGALAFIVVYNMTDINIIERIREIATVKVLGFHGAETAAYVFRENLILAALGALAGLPLGRLLHAFMIRQIHVDLVYFELRVAPVSYVCAVALTFLFVLIVDGAMYFRLDQIHMAEALKSID
ncbi:MAG: ABC transporter permease [Ruminococcaceae bacterium]|nr:ABC transporter permease [Oscillospiraceae bacterium]